MSLRQAPPRRARAVRTFAGNLPCVRFHTRKENHDAHPILSLQPGTAPAIAASPFALGGSAFAVGERIQSPSVAQQRCTNGATEASRT